MTKSREYHATARAARSGLTPAEIALVLVVLFALFAAAWLAGRASDSELTTVPVQVRAGDTLWTLAKRYPIPGLDTPRTVDLLEEANQLQGVTLTPGTSLKVLVADEGAPEVAMR